MTPVAREITATLVSRLEAAVRLAERTSHCAKSRATRRRYMARAEALRDEVIPLLKEATWKAYVLEGDRKHQRRI